MRKRALERSGDSVRIRVDGVVQGCALRPRTGTGANSEATESVSRRDAEVDTEEGIHVTTDGCKMILTGTVRSWAERRAAEHAAWKVPGILRSR